MATYTKKAQKTKSEKKESKLKTFFKVNVLGFFKSNDFSPPECSDDTLDSEYLFDFLNYGGSGYFGNDVYSEDSELTSNKRDNQSKIKASPQSVLDELERIPSPISMVALDDKIKLLEDKKKLIKQKYSRRDVEGLLERLNNRKNYAKYKSFFDTYDTTTDEKISALLAKYDLVMEKADLFIPEFPKDAIETMKAYSSMCELVSGKLPVFYVIATRTSFKQAQEKRDPILLVQSPFGFFWQILGAWDKEMLILSEL